MTQNFRKMNDFISYHGFEYRGYWIIHYTQRGYLGAKHLFHTFVVENHPQTAADGHGKFQSEAQAKAYIDKLEEIMALRGKLAQSSRKTTRI